MLTILASLVFLVVMAVIFEERLIYFPSDDLETTPRALGLRHQELTLVTSDEHRLHAWFWPSPVGYVEPATERYTVLRCHGVALPRRR